MPTFSEQIPARFLCAGSHKLMSHPVDVVSLNPHTNEEAIHTYEKKYIEELIDSGYTISPANGWMIKPITPLFGGKKWAIYTNEELAQEINSFNAPSAPFEEIAAPYQPELNATAPSLLYRNDLEFNQNDLKLYTCVQISVPLTPINQKRSTQDYAALIFSGSFHTRTDVVYNSEKEVANKIKHWQRWSGQKNFIIEYAELSHEYENNNQQAFKILGFKDLDNNRRFTFLSPIPCYLDSHKGLQTINQIKLSEFNKIEFELDQNKRNTTDKYEQEQYDALIEGNKQQRDEFIREQNKYVPDGLIKTIISFDNTVEILKLQKAITSLSDYGSQKAPKDPTQLDTENLSSDAQKHLAADAMINNLNRKLNSFLQQASTEGLQAGSFNSFIDDFTQSLNDANGRILSAHNNPDSKMGKLKAVLFSATGKKKIAEVEKALNTFAEKYQTIDGEEEVTGNSFTSK